MTREAAGDPRRYHTIIVVNVHRLLLERIKIKSLFLFDLSWCDRQVDVWTWHDSVCLGISRANLVFDGTCLGPSI